MLPATVDLTLGIFGLPRRRRAADDQGRLDVDALRASASLTPLTVGAERAVSHARATGSCCGWSVNNAAVTAADVERSVAAVARAVAAVR